MNRILGLAIMTVLVVTSQAASQTPDPPRYEIAPEFTTINGEQISGGKVEPALGVRFTFNFNKNIAIESSGHLALNSCFSCTYNGDIFAGVKAGKRFKSWGIFGKVRPGQVSSTQYNIVQTGTT